MYVYIYFFCVAMAVFNPGRSSTYQKFQVPTLAVVIEFSQRWTITLDRYTTAKQSDGTMVSNAFFDASCV